MPFDPTLPVNNSPVSSAELRSQFIGLNDLIYDFAAQANENLNNSAAEGLTLGGVRDSFVV